MVFPSYVLLAMAPAPMVPALWPHHYGPSAMAPALWPQRYMVPPAIIWSLQLVPQLL